MAIARKNEEKKTNNKKQPLHIEVNHQIYAILEHIDTAIDSKQKALKNMIAQLKNYVQKELF